MRAVVWRLYLNPVCQQMGVRILSHRCAYRLNTSRQIFTKTKRLNGSKTIVFDFNIIFVFINCLTTNAFKKVQYGYHRKNGVFSDNTERT